LFVLSSRTWDMIYHHMEITLSEGPILPFLFLSHFLAMETLKQCQLFLTIGFG